MVDVAGLLARAQGEVAAVIDVGAFAGGFSIAAAAERPQTLFVAVEPVPELAAHLRDATASLPNFRVVEAAAGLHRGAADLFVPSSGVYNFSSLLPLRAERVDWRGISLDRRIRVAVRPLADIVEELVPAGQLAAKIDAQGSDLAVLESLGPHLSRLRAGVLETAVTRRTLLYEQSPTRRRTVRALRRYGFEVVGIEPEQTSNHEQNLYFVRRDLLARWRVWRLAYPALVAAAWLRCLAWRWRARLAVRTRLRRLLGGRREDGLAG